MDVDKSLDDMIAEKRASRPQRAPRQADDAGRAPRQAPVRRDAPYSRPPPRSTGDKWVHDAYQGPRDRRPAGFGQGSHGGAGFAGSSVGFTGVSPRIQVENIHYEVTPADLKGIFIQAGTLVQGPTIRYDRSGRSTGIATMEYASPQQAKIAINKFDGAMTKGQTISIRLLPPPRPTVPAVGVAAPNQGAAGNASLLSRMSGGSLASRVGPAPGSAAAQRQQNGNNGGDRGARPASRARGGNAPRDRGTRKPREKPATADDLDKALDSFMKPADKAADVDMA